MALPFPVTPKNFTTPKKSRITRTSSAKDNFEGFAAPTTPRSQFTTPKASSKIPSVTSTPECFNTVTFDTPNSVRKERTSKEKFDEISNLTVAVRVRPMNSRELACVGAADVVRVREEELIIRSSPTASSGMSLDHIFQYDHVFWSCDETTPMYSSQEDVFLTIGKPLLFSAFRGYNACLFAYGQTGSGKSYSMMGRNTCEVQDIDSQEFSGLTPRFCRDLFDRITKLDPECTASVEVSYFEIYNEKIHDLLASSNSDNKTPLKVREHPEFGPYVVDLSVHVVKSYKELRNWLLVGNRNRATAATTMNEKSSRSHSIFSIELCLTGGPNENSSRRSKVSLVDLAGSERIGNFHSSDEKMRQGVSINKSLLTLGKVISALADQKKNQFVPYRDSVLTWLLKESLGGNSLTCMLATITPANSHLDETLATLRYACQARSIVNRARINENPHDRLIRELKSEVQRLKALKQNYERHSLSITSCSATSDDGCHIEELRNKLQQTEEKLQSAEDNWKQRFIECARMQQEELAQSEKRREELESKIRVINNVDSNKCDISIYKSDFLKELEDVLDGEENLPLNECDSVNKIVEWCFRNNLHCKCTSSTITILDKVNLKQTVLLLKDLDKICTFKGISEFINSLTWTDVKKPKQLKKSEIMFSLNQIYQALNILQPPENENTLNLLYAKVNKSLQSFEAALLHSVSKCNVQKTVSFDL